MRHTLGILFDGSGGFPLVGSMCGIEPVWASDVGKWYFASNRLVCDAVDSGGAERR